MGGGGEGHIWKQSIQTSALQTTVSSKTEKQYREMAQQLFFFYFIKLPAVYVHVCSVTTGG